MSRYTVLDAPEGEIILGYDPPLRAFFGQRFDPHRERVVGGFPTAIGLGDVPRIETLDGATLELTRLVAWALDHGAPKVAVAEAAGAMIREWHADPGEISGPYRLLQPVLRGETAAPIAGDHVEAVCRIGQGAATCRYLAASMGGFVCEKRTRLGAVLKAKADAGKMVSRGDNCPGAGLQ